MRPRPRLSAPLALTVLLALLLTACGQAVGNPGVAAVVNGEEIPIGELEDLLFQAQSTAAYTDQIAGGADAAQLEAQATQALISQLIVTELLVQGAADLGLDEPDDAAVSEELQTIIDTQLGGQEGYEALLEQQGLTEAEVRDQVRLIVLQNGINDALAAQAEVDDADVQAAYDAQFSQPSVAHILVATEDEALEVLDRLAQGESFELLASTLSLDPGSAAQGGDLGPLQIGAFVPEFEAAALALAEGETTTEPVQTAFGFHIIRLNAPVPLEEVEEQIRAGLQAQQSQQAVQDFQNELLFGAEITVNPRFGAWDPFSQAVVPSSPLGELAPVGTVAEPGLPGLDEVPPQQ